MCSLQNGAIAPNLHFNSLNPHIDLANSRLVVPTAATWLLITITSEIDLGDFIS